jgi:O-acetyl-ADP-ribose deacetylase (regulator of RNase III)
MIHYLIGDATEPIAVLGEKIIIHCVNNIGAWGTGFVISLGKKYPSCRQEYWNTWRTKKLGDIVPCSVAFGVTVIHMFGQQGIYYIRDVPPIRYNALRSCLEKIAKHIKENFKGPATVHCPRFGTGLASGNWAIIEKIIEETLLAKDIEVYVYDLPKKH